MPPPLRGRGWSRPPAPATTGVAPVTGRDADKERGRRDKRGRAVPGSIGRENTSKAVLLRSVRTW
jgi:hypothetical protein